MRDNCFLGVNSTIRDGIEIANHTLIGAGSLITRNTNQYDVYKAKYAELSKVKSSEVLI